MFLSVLAEYKTPPQVRGANRKKDVELLAVLLFLVLLFLKEGNVVFQKCFPQFTGQVKAAHLQHCTHIELTNLLPIFADVVLSQHSSAFRSAVPRPSASPLACVRNADSWAPPQSTESANPGEAGDPEFHEPSPLAKMHAQARASRPRFPPWRPLGAGAESRCGPLTGVPPLGLKGRRPVPRPFHRLRGWSPAAPPAHLQPHRCWAGPGNRVTGSNTLARIPPTWTPRSPVTGSPRSRQHG